MSKVFVSYRREDTQGEAGHLLADLRRRFGEDRVFMDIAAIGPGEDFGLAIERAMVEPGRPAAVVQEPSSDWAARIAQIGSGPLRILPGQV
jgi:hypothetical protein